VDSTSTAAGGATTAPDRPLGVFGFRRRSFQRFWVVVVAALYRLDEFRIFGRLDEARMVG